MGARKANMAEKIKAEKKQKAIAIMRDCPTSPRKMRLVADIIRGVVMNPVDHPMGGGEGRASGGHPRSRKGLLAKGYKTRNPKKTTSKFIISKKKK